MSRVKRSVHARKKRRKVLKEAKGYFGRKHSSYRFAKEQVQRSGMYAYRDRRNRKRDFRRLWITRINAAARLEGMSYSELIHGLEQGRGRGQPQDARRDRGQRPRCVPPICGARPGGCGRLARSRHSTLPGRAVKTARFFVPGEETTTRRTHPRQDRPMIASPQNEKLKLVRKLRERKHREREGLFVTEGEDLVEAGLAAGARAALPADRRRLRASGGEEVEPELLAAVSVARLRARGRSPSGRSAGPRRRRPPCVYLHGVGDPGNVGAIVRTAHALLDGTVVARARLRRPLLAEGGAGQHGLDLRPAAGAGRARGDAGAAGGAGRPRRRRARGARPARRRSASAPSARACPPRCSPQCEVEVTIPLRPGGAESLNVAAAAAIACERISSPAMPEARPDA